MKFIVAFTILSLIFSGFVMSQKHLDYHLSRGEQLVNSISANTAKIIEKKYSLKACGSGAAMPGGPIQEVTLCFDTKCLHTQEQLRELLVKSAQELLNQINENGEIQQFIKTPPFTINDVEIIIYNNDKNGRNVHDPEISTARISQGNLIYRTTEESTNFKFKNRIEESYEQALKFIK